MRRGGTFWCRAEMSTVYFPRALIRATTNDGVAVVLEIVDVKIATVPDPRDFVLMRVAIEGVGSGRCFVDDAGAAWRRSG